VEFNSRKGSSRFYEVTAIEIEFSLGFWYYLGYSCKNSPNYRLYLYTQAARVWLLKNTRSLGNMKAIRFKEGKAVFEVYMLRDTTLMSYRNILKIFSTLVS
jgi:hypothetical protein